MEVLTANLMESGEVGKRGRERGREGGGVGGSEGKQRGGQNIKLSMSARVLPRSRPLPFLRPAATVRRPARQHAGLPRSQDAAAPPGAQQQRAHLALLAEERQDLHQPHHSSQGTSLRPARCESGTGVGT